MLIALFAVIRIVTLRAVEGRCCHDDCDITLNETTQCLEGCRVQASRQAATRRILGNVRSKGNETAFIRHRNRVQQVRPLLLVRRIVPLQGSSCRCRRPRCCRTHSHRETRKSVWNCVPRTQRLSSPEETTVAPSVTRQHTPRKHVLGSANTFLQSTVQLLMCVGVCWRSCKEEENREAHQDGKRHSWMAAIHAVRPQPQQPCTVAAHTHPQKQEKNKKKKRKQHGGRVWLCVCVWRCGCLPALTAKAKQKKRERNVCSAPQALVARPRVTAPSARRSSRPLLMRAAGEAHRAVVMSVSVGVRVEQLGGKHTAPLTGRVQKKQLKEGRVEKKKKSIVIAPKVKKEKGWGVRDLKKKKLNNAPKKN
ncbi:hypothetical protein ECC02_013697 [Trypanosoma cruzi]|uniref:Secreted protein n=1 Tax=Trypanosoma cruzi TaxID=5693 RepID=A0A7J6XGX7_TRYCR|nr:hypothetical protein ECC02_013697 [Trypanosoma cruzi]